MKTVAARDRPREKLARLGAAALGDNELAAIVLGQGQPRVTALELGNRVLAAAADAAGLARMTHEELTRIAGIGPARAAQLLAAVELGRRSVAHAALNRVQLLGPRGVAEYLLAQYGNPRVEQFGVLLLDTRRRVLRGSVISIGTLDASIVHPREIFREAIARGAAALVLFHNHPSGDPEPSREDTRLTERLVAAGLLMGIEVLDHVILGDARYFSYREKGSL